MATWDYIPGQGQRLSNEYIAADAVSRNELDVQRDVAQPLF